MALPGLDDAPRDIHASERHRAPSALVTRPFVGRSSSRANGLNHPDSKQNVLSSRSVAHFSGALWAVAAAIGLLAVVLPHGEGVHAAGWLALCVFAMFVAAWIWLMGERHPPWVNYVLSVVAVCAVSGAVASARTAPVAYAVCSLYLLPTVFAASFYPSRAFVTYVVGQAAVAAAVLLTSPLPGASAAWVALMGTISTVGVVVHVLHQALMQAATTDALTGLINRRAFEPVLAKELDRCARLGHPLALVVLDLDHFKEVNDRLGHGEGDRILAEVSRSWGEQLRSADVLARSGGDEFVLLLPSTGWAQAMDVLARLSRSTTHEFSAGIAVGEPGSELEDVLRRADDACCKAKRTGRAQVVLDEGSYSVRTASI